MPIQISMPRLSDTMERGTIVHWNVKEGDAVKPGMVLGDIETDKATMELQAFDTGTVAAILLKEGDSVDVGKNILVLAEEGEDAGAVRATFAGGGGAGAAAANKPAAAAANKPASGGAGSSGGGAAVASAPAPATARAGNGANAGNGASGGNGVASSDRATGRVFASPLARKIADERGIDLAGIRGTGPSGRITRKDVEAAGAPSGGRRQPEAAGASAAAAAGRSPAAMPAAMLTAGGGLESRVEQLSNMRRTIATRLVQSKQTIPHYQVTVAVNMDALLALRGQLNEQLAAQNVKLSVNDFLVRACALAMHEHPYVNSSWGRDGASIELHERVNIGVAISLPMERGGGLVVATLRDADRTGLRQISADTKALAEKARTRGLSIEEMDGSTFTISNLGMFGVEHFTAIINPPNVAILAVGAAVEKPVARNGQLVVGHEMQMTMSSDHRVVDGAMAAAYLQTVKRMLEAPATLLV
ncbi:MAG: dihydrolipoamide acetyltransferase family protein [Planctomycetota bacterium]|nr:dihydrolipoamide acetyltransferase family protein [Planctomycetota bacterium]